MFEFEYEYLIPICIRRSGIWLICYKLYQNGIAKCIREITRECAIILRLMLWSKIEWILCTIRLSCPNFSNLKNQQRLKSPENLLKHQPEVQRPREGNSRQFSFSPSVHITAKFNSFFTPRLPTQSPGVAYLTNLNQFYYFIYFL